MKKILKKLFILLILLSSVLPTFAEPRSAEERFWREVERINSGRSYTESTDIQPPPIWREEGVYVNGRAQVSKHQRICPPYPEKIPMPRPTHTVEPYDSYYKNQILGIRRPVYKEPVIPNYNVHYSNRRAKPYLHRDYLDVWCIGKIDYEQNMCSVNGYDIYFAHARNWAARAMTLPFKIRQAKAKGNRVGLFLEVDDVGLDSEYVIEAKSFAKMFNLTIFSATIDSYIPIEWYPD